MSVKAKSEHTVKQEPSSPFAQLAPGRIIMYVMPHIRKASQYHRPAVVVRVENPDDGIVTLTVFVDTLVDHYADPYVQMRAVKYDPEGAPNTWHWPVVRR